ncbi:hypothetical protein TNCV_2922561 [Trichonephila clavipes]|nr:hypothetical protein TNCV_2922561 [Trichonephila clavipes]
MTLSPRCHRPATAPQLPVDLNTVLLKKNFQANSLQPCLHSNLARPFGCIRKHPLCQLQECGRVLPSDESKYTKVNSDCELENEEDLDQSINFNVVAEDELISQKQNEIFWENPQNIP